MKIKAILQSVEIDQSTYILPYIEGRFRIAFDEKDFPDRFLEIYKKLAACLEADKIENIIIEIPD